MTASLPTLDGLEVDGRRVLVRADLNVPLRDGRVADPFRIEAFAPTARRLMDAGAKVVVCSHLGRPAGPDPDLSLAPIAAELGERVGSDVRLAADVAGEDARRIVGELASGSCALLENLRFEPGETANDPDFAAALSGLADAYVNDAFGACHRAHASIVGPPTRLPSAAGPLLQREVSELGALLADPPRPFVVVLGGAKVADKIGVVKQLLRRADRILIGGGMCFTFLKARGEAIGASLIDEASFIDVSSIVWDDALMLPTDIVVADDIGAAEAWDVVRPGASFPSAMLGLDIGPATADAFAAEIAGARTVFWNGPMGVFETDAFAHGTGVVARAVADCDGHAVTGGGDTAAALARFGLSGTVDFESTGGGASLEFLEGQGLPGLDALT